MKYIEAIQLKRRIKEICEEPLAAMKKEAQVAGKLRPEDDDPAGVLCKVKLSRDEPNAFCCVMDGSPCPRGVSLSIISNLRI